uniref:GTP-binding protein 8 n=1 Tax=Strigamia maritima TaxID=126957 RepID=T1IQD1_STRMM
MFMFTSRNRELCRHTLKNSLSRFRTSKEGNIDLFTDPSNELQKWLKIPLFRKDEKPFAPDEITIKKAGRLFRPSNTNKIQFVKSVFDNPEHYPVYKKPNLPEILFLGYSNSGKSTLIKALFKHNEELVRTSSKPGHTQLLNFFQAGDQFVLVDAPGYGQNEPENFRPAVEKYLETRKNLRRTFLLIDSSIGMLRKDKRAIKMLERHQRPFALIMTKIDTTPTSIKLTNLMEMQRIRDEYSSPFCYPQPFLVSGLTYEGLGFLQAFITHETTDHVVDENINVLHN